MYQVNTGLARFFCASILMTASSAVSALQVGGSVGVDVRYTDNAGLVSSSEQEDLITTARVTAVVTEDQGPLTGNASAELRQLDYLDNTFGSQTYLRLDSIARWEQLTDRLVWTVSDYFDQTSIDSLSANTPDNTEDTNAFSLSALATFPVADRHRITVSPSFRDFSSDVTGNDNQQLGVDTGWIYQLDPTITLSLNGSFTDVDYEDASTPDNERTSLDIMVDVSRARSQYSARLGATKVESDGGSKTDGVTGSISWQYDFTGRSSIAVFASSDITDSSNIFLSSSANPNTGSFNNIQASSDTVRDDVIRMTYSRQGSAISSRFWTELRELDYETVMLDRDVQEVGASVDYAITPLVTGTVGGGFIRTEDKASISTDKDYQLNGSLNYSVSRKLTATVGVRVNKKTSNVLTREYDELSVLAGVNYRLGR